ncbi:MAG: PEP-CTERM system TPR-repeat protein PrsT [Gammaproteobacteria bacterium]|nr:PEP-CTERM system TPR-repeat protein PrsT [Gammaproteobacteria bacterium]
MRFKYGFKRRLVLGAMVSAALVLGAVGCSSDANLTDAEYVERAKEYQDKGELQASVIDLKNALQKNPNNAEARWLLGKIYLALDNATAAEKELLRARDLGIASIAIAVPLGKALLAQGEAKRVLDEIAVPSGVSAEVRTGVLTVRGEAYLKLGQRDMAQAELSEALEACANSKCSDTWLALSNLEMDKGNSIAAKEWITKATIQDPKNVTAWLYLGEFEDALSHPKETLEAYNKAVQVAPGDFRALYARAVALLDSGQVDQAKVDLEAMRKRMPKSPALSYIEGRFAIHNKDYAKAQSHLENFLKTSPRHPVANYYLAVAHVAQGHLQQAETRLTQLLAAYPNAMLTRRLLATVQAASGNSDNAINTLEPFIRKNTDDPGVLSLIGRIYLQKGDPRSGATYLQRAVEIEPKSAQTRMLLGQAFNAQGKSELALEQFDAVLKLDPKSTEAAVMRIMTHIRNKNYDAALQAIDSLKGSVPKSPLPDSLAASVYLVKRDYSQARQSLEHALSLDPKFIEARVKLAQLAQSQRDVAAARVQYQKVLELDPNHLDSLIALAGFDVGDRKIAVAVQKLERAIKAHPESDRPYVELARLYLDSGDALKALAVSSDGVRRVTQPSPVLLEVLGIAQLATESASAVTTFKQLVELAPSAASAQLHLATAWAKLGDVKETRKALNESLRLRPRQIEAKAALARLELQQGQPSQTLRLAGEIRKDFPASPEADVLEAEAYLQQRRLTQAWQAYDQAMHKGAPAIVLRDYALARDLTGDGPAAERLLLDWLVKQPNDAVTRSAVGELYLRHGELDKARQALETAVKQLPNHPGTLNNLAWIYGQSGKDKRALQYAEKAYQLQPNDPLIADTLGWLVLDAGDMQRAVDLLADAYKRAPRHGGIAYHYASALVRQGKSQQAKSVLEQVLASGVPFDDRNQANTLLLKIK